MNYSVQCTPALTHTRARESALQAKAGSTAATKACSLNITLTYYGNDARVKAESGMAAAINKAKGMCQYGVCAAVTKASKGKAKITSAAADTTKTFSDGTTCCAAIVPYYIYNA
jgi:hypothetical protein